MKTRTLTLIVSIMSFAGIVSAQTNEKQLTWKLLQTEAAVSVYKAYEFVDNNPIVLFKVENKSQSDIIVSWDSQFIFSDKRTLEVDKSFSVQVNTLETVQGDDAGSELSLNPYDYVSTIEEGVTDYTIKNLSVIEL